MNAQAAKRARTLAGSVVLLAGLVYTVLTLTAKPAYASSCDCDNDDEIASVNYCQRFGTHVFPVTWACPDPNQPGYFRFECQDISTGYVYGTFDLACQ